MQNTCRYSCSFSGHFCDRCVVTRDDLLIREIRWPFLCPLIYCICSVHSTSPRPFAWCWSNYFLRDQSQNPSRPRNRQGLVLRPTTVSSVEELDDKRNQHPSNIHPTSIQHPCFLVEGCNSGVYTKTLEFPCCHPAKVCF